MGSALMDSYRSSLNVLASSSGAPLVPQLVDYLQLPGQIYIYSVHCGTCTQIACAVIHHGTLPICLLGTLSMLMHTCRMSQNMTRLRMHSICQQLSYAARYHNKHSHLIEAVMLLFLIISCPLGLRDKSKRALKREYPRLTNK